MARDFLPNEDYYDTAEQLLTETDIVETDIRIVGWNKKFRVRGLDFGQMDRINKRATILETDKDKGLVAGEIDNKEWVYWTIVEGVVRPKFTYLQAKKLSEKNGSFVQELADNIWEIGRLSRTLFDTYISELQRNNKLEKEKQS